MATARHLEIVQSELVAKAQLFILPLNLPLKLFGFAQKQLEIVQSLSFGSKLEISIVRQGSG